MAANATLYINALDRSSSRSEYSLRAIRASDGALLWRHASPVETEVTQIIAAHDTLYVHSMSQSLLEVDSVEAWRIDNGSLLWRNRVEGMGSGPLVVNQGVVYVSCFAPHGISALRASDGDLLWRCQFEQDVTYCAASKGIVYVALNQEANADDRGALVALRANDGVPLWRQPVDQEVTALTVSEESVYIGLADKTCLEVPHVLEAPGTSEQEQRTVARPHPQERNLLLTEANKALVHRFFEEVLSKGNVTVANELLAPGYLSSRDEYLPGLPSGLKGFKYLLSLFHTAFPDGHFDHFTVQSHYVEEDLVVTHYEWHGTNTGDLPGRPPTGNSFTFEGMSLIRIAHGKIVQSWYSFDSFAADLLAELGVDSRLLSTAAT